MTSAAASNVDRNQIRLKLALMMFFEYGVWGSWMAIFSATLVARGAQGQDIGNIFAAMWLACAITPFIGGQIADRIMPGERLLAISHGLAAVAAFMVASQQSVNGFLLWTFIWSLLFAPSLGGTNAIAFFHIDRLGLSEPEKEREFAIIRTAGTIGWIVASALLFQGMFFLGGFDRTGKTGLVTEWVLCGGLGVIMTILSFFLPHTPPASKANTDPLAFRKAFGLFKKVPGFTVFMLISFVAATEFQFFYTLSAPFLEGGAFTQVPHDQIGMVKAISQVAEILALAVLLPLWLPKFGMRWCLLVGSFAWPLRYFIFSAGQPAWLVIASLALHGFGYAFVLVVQQLYVDRVAPADIRSSAQNLLNLITLGVGSFLGSLISGWIMSKYTVDGKTDWTMVFLIPGILTTICALAYMFTFRNPTSHEEASMANSTAR